MSKMLTFYYLLSKIKFCLEIADLGFFSFLIYDLINVICKEFS